MKYDKAFFDAGIERKHTRCVKWDAGFIGPDDLPMWVADWDFACPEPIVQALRQRADGAVNFAVRRGVKIILLQHFHGDGHRAAILQKRAKHRPLGLNALRGYGGKGRGQGAWLLAHRNQSS